MFSSTQPIPSGRTDGRAPPVFPSRPSVACRLWSRPAFPKSLPTPPTSPFTPRPTLLLPPLQVERLTLLTDQASSRTRGAGFVVFTSRQAASEALAALHGRYTFPGASAPLVLRWTTPPGAERGGGGGHKRGAEALLSERARQVRGQGHNTAGGVLSFWAWANPWGLAGHWLYLSGLPAQAAGQCRPPACACSPLQPEMLPAWHGPSMMDGMAPRQAFASPFPWDPIAAWCPEPASCANMAGGGQGPTPAGHKLPGTSPPPGTLRPSRHTPSGSSLALPTPSNPVPPNALCPSTVLSPHPKNTLPHHPTPSAPYPTPLPQLFVAKILKSSPEEEVRALLSQYGPVERIFMFKPTPDAVFHKVCWGGPEGSWTHAALSPRGTKAE